MGNTAEIEELFESIDELYVDDSDRDNDTEDIILPNNEDEETSNKGFDVDSLVAKIDAKIAELEAMERELGEEESKIIELIKGTLEKNNLRYSFDSDRPKLIEVGFGTKNKPFKLYIFLQNEKVILRAMLPIRVQCNSLAIVSMFIADFNKNKAFSLLNLDLDDGELSMEYSYLLNKATDYNEKQFWIYMTSIIVPLQEVYTKLCHLALGKISNDKKSYYKALLEKSLAVINGDEEDADDIIFGSEDMDKYESVRGFLDMLKKGSESEASKEDSDNPRSFLETDSEAHRNSLFEEFLRMKRVSDSSSDDKENIEHKQEDDCNMLPFDLLEFTDDDQTGTEK